MTEHGQAHRKSVGEERSLEGPALQFLILGITAVGDGWTLHVPVIHLEQREGSVKPGKGLSH